MTLHLKKFILIFFAVILAGTAFLWVLSFQVKNDLAAQKKVISNEDRIEFLNSCGWITETMAEEQKILIPSEFSGFYNDYNMIQISQGFDLSRYKGEEAVQYLYRVKNYPGGLENVYACMIVYKERIIGGDIRLTEPGGFVLPLAKTQEENSHG